MAGQRQPIELVLAKVSKHLTKKEIEERKSSEVKPITDNIFPPPYLSTKKQEEEKTYEEKNFKRKNRRNYGVNLCGY